MKFDEIKSIKDIKAIISSNSSDDGESVSFELKGANDELSFNRDIKTKLNKEICAFANTYGGTLCFHNGTDREIDSFSDEYVKTNYQSIESWLNDALEPRLLGMEFKCVENVLLIYIPESVNKPHRTNEGKKSQYYYRHITQSTPMPEIMVSSMYRSQDYLDFELDVNAFQNPDYNQLSVRIEVHNVSNLAGSLPKIELEIFTNKRNPIVLSDGKNIRSLTKSWDFTEFEKLFRMNSSAFLETSSYFSEQILYPKDKLRLDLSSEGTYTRVECMLLRVSCIFKEVPKKTFFKLIDFSDANNSCNGVEVNKVYASQGVDKIIGQFNEIIRTGA